MNGFEQLLERLGADPEAEQVRRWMDPRTGPAPALREPLRQAAAGTPGAARLGSLVALCRYEEALAVPAGGEAVWFWRAEAELQSGRLAEAERAIERAERAFPEDARALCLKALLAMSQGRGAEAAAALERAGADPVAVGLGALAAHQEGERERAYALAERLLELRPRAGWPLALRATLRRWEEDFAAGLADFEAALEREPESAWIRRRYSECLEKSGRMEAAIAESRRAVELSLPHAHLHWQLGHLLFYRKQYESAVEQFTRAVALAPADAAMGWQRANALWLSGRFAEALEQARECLRLEPGCTEYRLGVARYLMWLGREEQAWSLLRRWSREGGAELEAGVRFQKGVLLFRRRNFAQAAKEFARAEALVRSGEASRKFLDVGYSALATAMAFVNERGGAMQTLTPDVTAEGEAAPALLILAGLGLHYPYQASLETLQAVSQCDTVFSNLAGPDAMEFLSLFCKDVRTVSYEHLNDEPRWVEKIFSGVAPGRKVAFVTRGHPHVAGLLAAHLVARAKKLGVQVRSYGCISTADVLVALTQQDLLLTWQGAQIYDSQTLLLRRAPVRNDFPMILFLGIPMPEQGDWLRSYFTQLRRMLEEQYPASHPMYLFGPRYEIKKLDPVRLEGLEEKLQQVEPRMVTSMILYVPPVIDALPMALDPEHTARADRT